jgi:hypothetical protein
MADVEAGPATEKAIWREPWPEDKEAARAWGKKKKQVGIAMMGAAVSCTGGMIGGIGGGTGNWGAAIGGASGLFFGLAGGGGIQYKQGQKAIAYADGAR